MVSITVQKLWAWQTYNDDMWHTAQSGFKAPKPLCALPVYPSLFSKPLANTDTFNVPIVLPFLECHVVGIIQYVAFSGWFLSLSNMHLTFLHVFSWFDGSFLFSVE